MSDTARIKGRKHGARYSFAEVLLETDGVLLHVYDAEFKDSAGDIFAPAEARKIAEALLKFADKVDGDTP